GRYSELNASRSPASERASRPSTGAAAAATTSKHSSVPGTRSVGQSRGKWECPQRDSNPRYHVERVATWAASRWGRPGQNSRAVGRGDNDAGGTPTPPASVGSLRQAGCSRRPLPRTANPAAVIMRTNPAPTAVPAISVLDKPESVPATETALASGADCAADGVPVEAASL